jgi:hypothetical protein
VAIEPATAPVTTTGGTRSRRVERLAVAMVVGGYLIARFVPMIGTRIGTGYDTGDYFKSSRLGLWSRDLWAGPRPALYPLLAKITGRSYTGLFVLQATVAVVAWIALAWLVYTRLRNRAVAAATAIVVLYESLSLGIIQWDRVLSTESLTLSMAIVLLVLGVLLLESPTRWRAVSFTIVAAAWVLLRDSNGYVIVCIAAALVVAAICSRAERRTFLAVAGALAVVFALGVMSSNIGERWEGPLKDVITLRALTYPDRTHYLLEHGLPLTSEDVSRVAGHCVARTRPYFICVPVTDPRFYQWIRKEGRSTYSGWLLSHPATALNDPIRHSDFIFGTRVRAEVLTFYRFEPASFADRIFFVRNQGALLAEALVAFGLAIVTIRRRRFALGWVVITAFVTIYPHMLVTWTFGALETTRHSLGASVMLAVSIVLAVGCALDAVFEHGSSVEV